MKHTHKQIIVMFFSVLFMATVGIIVLSATAAAGYVDPCTSASIRDSNLRTADSVLSGDYYQESIYNNPSSGDYRSYIYTPSQYDRDIDNRISDAIDKHRHDIERDNKIVHSGIIRDAMREAATEKEPDTRPQPINHTPISINWFINAFVLLIIGFMVVFMVAAYINNKTTYTDTPDTTEPNTPDIPNWLNELDEHDRHAVLDEIEKEFKR